MILKELYACPFRYPREKNRFISYFHRRREKLKDQLTTVRTAKEECYPWERPCHLPARRRSSECHVTCSVELSGLCVAEERSEDVLEEVTMQRVERTSWTREEEKGVAVVTSVKCREMKVTFTPTTETETYCLNHYSKAVIELRPKYHCESCHTDVCRECFMRKCLSHDVNWVGNKQFRCVSPFHVHQK